MNIWQDKPISRILSLISKKSTGNHLSGYSVTTIIKRQLFATKKRSTVLHSGKDLAVSLLIFLPRLAPKGALFFSKQSVSARTSFYCVYASNTIQTGVTRYPVTFRLKPKSECPDFPLRQKGKAIAWFILSNSHFHYHRRM